MLVVLTLTVFLLSLALLISASYLLVEAPMAKRRLMARIQALRETTVRTEDGAGILRKEIWSDIPLLNRILILTPGIPKLSLFLEQAGLTMQVGTFTLVAASLTFAGLFSSLVFSLNAPSALLAVVGLPLVPFGVVSVIRRKRLAKFEEQFPEAIDLLARAVRAGHAFTTGFELISKELPDPVGEEFRLTYQQQNLGLPLREALGNMSVRVPLPDVRIFVSALQIQRESGGNLGEILDTLSAVIRERFKLQRQVKVFTAEGRVSMYMLSAIPLVALGGLYALNPGYISPLFSDPRGHYMLAGAAVMQIIGYFVIRRLVRIEV